MAVRVKPNLEQAVLGGVGGLPSLPMPLAGGLWPKRLSIHGGVGCGVGTGGWPPEQDVG